jgi:hypothetical protein
MSVVLRELFQKKNHFKLALAMATLTPSMPVAWISMT